MEAASNGNMRAAKYAWTSILAIAWCGIGIRYGKKLSDTLAAGGKKDGPNHQLRKIQKYIFALVLGGTLGSLQKLFLIPKFLGKNLFRNLPLCTMKGFYMGGTTSVYVIILIIQYAIVFAQQPGKKTVRSVFSGMASTIVSGRSSRRGSISRGSSVAPSTADARSGRKSSVSSSASEAPLES
jgi:hypothetical protein